MILNLHILQEYIIQQKYRTEKGSFIDTYLNDAKIDYSGDSVKCFAQFSFSLSSDCDVYNREYISLLNTISTIGGLFSPFQLLFQVY